MVKYILVRFVWIFFNLLLIVSALYIVSTIIMMLAYSGPHPFKDDVEFIAIRYYEYMKGILLKWNWGETRFTHKSVWTLLLPKIPVTLKLNLIAVAIYIPVGILLGVIASVKKNTLVDNVINIVTLIFYSIPSFIMIFILIWFFGYYLDVFPSLYPPADAAPDKKALSLFIPVIALSLEPIAGLARIMRGELSEAMNADYLLLARTKGLSKRQSIVNHALRNSMVPVLPTMITAFVTIFSSCFFIEYTYNIPGAARFFLSAIVYPSIDTNIMIICATFFSALSLFSILCVDISYRLIDPRIRMGSKKSG